MLRHAISIQTLNRVIVIALDRIEGTEPNYQKENNKNLRTRIRRKVSNDIHR